MTRNRMVWPAALTVVVLALAGCGGHQSKSPKAAVAAGLMSGSFAETLPSGGAAADGGDTAGAPDAGAGTTAAGPGDASDPAAAAGPGDAAKVPAMPYAAASSAAAAPGPEGGPAPYDTDSQGDQNVRVGLRAGSVDDNAHFADFLAYLNAFATLGQDVHEFDVTRRHVFTVTNQSGYPLLGAHIVITTSGNSNSGDTVADLLTDSSGRALWFPQDSSANSSFKAVVSKGNATAHVAIDPTSSVYQVTLDAPATTAPVPLDIEFVVDATGSMGDEIAQLKASLSDIAARIDALPAKPDVRFALTIYRDRVDSFLTRTWNFTPDLAGFEREIAGVTADGGGDDPEDVQQGLYDALHKPAWRVGGAAKLMVLIGDARPHLDYANDPDYVTTAVDAARMGVKIESLAASGLDDTGEYIWRQLAEITQGQFLFLTYGPNGGPGDTTTHHVDGYTPMNLEDLVVRLVSQELSPLGNRQPPTQQ